MLLWNKQCKLPPPRPRPTHTRTPTQNTIIYWAVSSPKNLSPWWNPSQRLAISHHCRDVTAIVFQGRRWKHLPRRPKRSREEVTHWLGRRPEAQRGTICSRHTYTERRATGGRSDDGWHKFSTGFQYHRGTFLLAWQGTNVPVQLQDTTQPPNNVTLPRAARERALRRCGSRFRQFLGASGHPYLPVLSTTGARRINSLNSLLRSCRDEF